MATPKRKYETVFKKAYSDEFAFIIQSRKGSTFAFCSICQCDFSIVHGGKRDIIKHCSTQKHKDNSQGIARNKKIDFAFQKSDDRVIHAESLFTAFIVEHNLPLSCADHVGPLFRKMFSDSEIAKKYGCARTKATAVIREMGQMKTEAVAAILKKVPFSIATDGSNKSDSKLFPIVVSYQNNETCRIETSLLSVPVLEGDCTGYNIAHLILETLKAYGIPLQNCLSLGADNAPVMVGKKTGVAGILKHEMEHLVVIGCSCHLINLAAEKGAACLPVKIDEVLIDIYYYLERSSKRKDKLKQFQSMHNTEVRKILKHVSTRWLSLGRCLSRLVQQWEPLTSFFKGEVRNSNGGHVNTLQDYKIPKHNMQTFASASNMHRSISPLEIVNTEKTANSKKRSSNSSRTEADCKKRKSTDSQRFCTGSSKGSSHSIISREERLFLFISSQFNKALCLFLLNILPIFEEPNVKLQSNIPRIHMLRSVFLEMFKNLLSRFVIPGIIKSSPSLLEVNYHKRENHKSDSDLVIGHSVTKIVENLKQDEKAVFFSTVRKYFISVCDYMIHKFPFKSDILINSRVAEMAAVDSASFSSLRFFVEKFPGLLAVLENADRDIALDTLQSQFCAFQLEDLPDNIKTEDRIDVQWSLVGKLTGPDGIVKYGLLSKVMLAILTIPHSNAECERMFSLVTKMQTQFRSKLSNQTLEKLLIVKSQMQGCCFEQNFDASYLKKAKSATVTSLKD